MNFYDMVISETAPVFTGEKCEICGDLYQYTVPTMVRVQKGSQYTLVRLRNLKKSSWRAFKHQTKKLEKQLISLFGEDFEFEFFGEVYANEFKKFPVRKGIIGVWMGRPPRRRQKGSA